jgi:hypothetical protein
VSGTRRTPINRPAVAQVTERAIDLWVAMTKLRCTCTPPPPEYWLHKMCPGCERWYELHGELNDELHCAPWQWPCAARASPKRAGSPTMNEYIAATMAMLKAAAKARRTASPSSEKEGSLDAEPVDAGREEPRN